MWLHHWFPSVHENVADKISHYCQSPPEGAIIQSNIMKGKQKCENTAKYSQTGSIKMQKKICINRHIIKYYVITEHILTHGVSMETDSED